MGNGNVFDIHGRLTGLSTRLVYRIATSGKFLWSHHGGTSIDAGEVKDVQGQPRGSGGSEWHKDSNECEWSIHEVAGSSNPKKYYIVTKGRVLSAAHGASNKTKRGKSYHKVYSRAKTGGSEWHRDGPESQWMFEPRGGDYFNIMTSHKVLWCRDGRNSNGVTDVYGENKPNAGGSQWHIDRECLWEFIPKMASYNSRLYDFTFVTPGEFSGTPQPNWNASVLLSVNYSNPAGSNTTLTKTYKRSKNYIHETEYTLENTTSITLSSMASVTAEASMPGLGSVGSTVETGTELSTSITNRGRFRWQQENLEEVTHTVVIAPGAHGRVVTTYFEGPFNMSFNCKCDLMASVKMAPTQAFAVQDPSSSYAHDEMLKSVLNGVGFNESGSSIQDIIYDYDKCTFVNSGIMRGESGLRSETIVTVQEGPEPAISTVNGPDDDSDMED